MKIFKTTMAGVIGACLVSFLLTGCGGNGEPSKEKTETKKVVRQKIPEAEKESAAKQKTAQEAAGKPAPASDTTAATKEEKQEPSAEQRPSKKIAGKAAETAAATGVTTEAEKTEKAAGKTEADAQKKVSETEPSAAASKDSVAATKAFEAPEKKSAETKKPVGAAKEKEPVAEKAVSKEEAVSEKEISAEKAGKEAAPEKTVPPEKAEEKAAKEPVAKETAKAEKKEAEKPAEKETKTAGEALTEAPAGTETAAAGTGPVIDFDLEEEVAAGEETEATSEKTEESFNPFSALFEKEKVASTGGSDQGGQRDRKFLTPLERIGLGQLQLKGIIMAESGNRAIVTDASGKGYVVTKGTYIGLNSGKVKRIESDRVVVVEKIGSRESKTVLKLQKPAGE